jgi:protein dithiol oxidoreductase (disulfide-forming)
VRACKRVMVQLLLCLWLLAACSPPAEQAPPAAQAPPTTQAPPATQTAAPLSFQEGQTHFALKAPQPTQVAADQVEVLEVFSYACSHCGELDPFVVAWEKSTTRSPAAKLRYLPAPWNKPRWMEYAATFFAAEKLGILERSHHALMDKLWKQHQPMVSMQEIAEFHAQFGVDAAAFLAELDTPQTQLKLLDTSELLPKYEISATPTFIVDGRWRFDVATAGGPQNVGPLIDFLVAEALKQRGQP